MRSKNDPPISLNPSILSEQPRLMEQLRESGDMYRELFDNLSDEVHLWKLVRDEKGEIVTWKLADVNPAALKAWKKEKAQIIGKTTDEIFGKGATEQFIVRIKEIFETGQSIKWVEYFEPTDQYLSMTSIPMGAYFISAGRDITEEKRAENTLKESQELLQKAEVVSDQGSWKLDILNNQWTFSANWLKIHGLEHTRIDRDKLLAIAYPADREKITKAWQDAFDDKVPYEIEHRIIKQDTGEIRWLKSVGEVSYNEMGEPQVFFGVAKDITTQKQAQQELIESEERLRQVTNTVPGTIYQFRFNKDGSYSIPFISDRANELLGFDYEQMKSPEFLFSRVHPEDFEPLLHSISEANKDKSFWSAEFRAINKKNEIVWIKGNSAGEKDPEGRIVHSGLFLNITDKKDAEAALKESEQKYRNIAENLPGIVVSYKLNPDGSDQLLYISKGVNELYEVSQEEAVKDNKLLWERVYKDDLEPYLAAIKHSATQLTPWKFEHRIQFPDGRIKWVYMIGIPVKQSDGSVIWDSIGLDITNQKQAERELELLNGNLEKRVEERTEEILKVSKQLELYRLAAEHSMSGVWLLDPVKDELIWDDVMYSLYGIKKDDFSSAYEAWKQCLHPEDRERIQKEMNKAILGIKPFDTIFKIVHPSSGRESHIRAKGKVEFDPSGKAIAVYGTNWDVSREILLAKERETALNNLKETQAQLVLSEKMATLGILTAGVAHEINNPLNYILGGCEVIDDYLGDNEEIDKTELSQYLEWIKAGAERASNIVKSLNLFSRNSDVLSEECNIHSIIDGCLLVTQNLYKDRIRVKRSFKAANSIVIGNNGKLHQAFLNVLSNAIDAIHDKGIITISSKNEHDHIFISIKDNGTGIEERDLQKIMEPFFTTKPPGKGTGLGLSITKSIIEEHNGTVSVLSRKGKGTAFTIQIPLKPLP